MTIFKRLFSLCAVVALVACGGGGGNPGTNPLGGGGPNAPGTGGGNAVPTAADVVLTLSAASVANTGAETVVATATAIDTNRNTVAGVPVTISVNSNAVVTPQGATTGSNGQLSATVGIGADTSLRTVTVTATSGSISKTASLTVQDAGGNTAAAPADLLLTLASATIGNSGTQTVRATATALDSRRNVLPGVVVSISVDAGATAVTSGTSTNNTGVVTADIGTGGNSALRPITVTATATGLAPRTTVLQVVNAPSTTAPVATDLSVTLSAASLPNGGTSTILATVTAVDANRNAVAGIPVALSVDNNAVATVSGANTNAQGVVTATIGIGSDRSNRSVIVTASSGTVTRSVSFSITGATLNFSPLLKVDAGSVGNQIEYRLLDSNGTPMPGQAFTVTAGGMQPTSGRTDPNGRFVYSFNAPSNPTILVITASAGGDTRSQSVAIEAPGASVPNAPFVPQSASLTPTPSVVSVNTAGSNANQVELRALFLGPNNQPVPNIRVRFSLDAANSSDGVASQVGGLVYAYSDATGVARGTFTPGQRSSPTNGVTVRACWDTVDFNVNAVCDPSRLVTNTLTIASEALSVNIRTNNLIRSGTANLTYIKEYVVMVVDAAGQAKPDVLITPSVDLTAYYKGYYFWNGDVWQMRLRLAATENYAWNNVSRQWTIGALTNAPMCPNEDANRNGVREAPIFSPSPAPAIADRQEDLNWNGEIDPRKADVAIKMVGSARTDANGLAIVQIEYGQNVASWVDYIITVTASGIAGTESRARYEGLLYGLGNLPFPAAAVGTETVPPSFVVSPYGRGEDGPPTVPPAPPIGVCTDNK